MEKKELLTDVLTKLIHERELSEYLLAYINSSYATSEAIDAIMNYIAKKIKYVKGENKKNQWQKRLDVLQKIKELEEKGQEDYDFILNDL